MPGYVAFALVAVGFQVGATAFEGFMVRSEINDRLDHGQEVWGPAQAIVYVAFIAAAALAVSAIFASMRYAWAMGVILVTECLVGVGATLGAVAAVMVGAFAANAPVLLGGIAFPFAIAVAISSRRSQEWFNR
jgi:hypothetical protein